MISIIPKEQFEGACWESKVIQPDGLVSIVANAYLSGYYAVVHSEPFQNFDNNWLTPARASNEKQAYLDGKSDGEGDLQLQKELG